MLRDTKMIALLAKHGASLDAPGRDGWTPLGLASRSNAKDTVKALLDAKAVRPRTLIRHISSYMTSLIAHRPVRSSSERARGVGQREDSARDCDGEQQDDDRRAAQGGRGLVVVSGLPL